jgi:hypothetical protein
MKRHYCTIAATLGLFALAGCLGAADEKGEGDSRSGETGLAITASVDTGGKTDVGLMRYSITRHLCVPGEKFDPLSRTITVPLETMQLPAGIPALDDNPLPKGSSHRFADHFEVVPAGCYKVSATPLTTDGEPSADCAASEVQNLWVLDGETTEVVLISQCSGGFVGAIDAAVALNQPPEIVDVKYSKFMTVGDIVTVCASAKDPNGDWIQFDWSQIDGGACYGPAFLSSEKDPLGITQCVGILPVDVGDYWFEVKMFDMLRDENGTLIRVEKWLRDHGSPGTSHDSLKFPLHVGAVPVGYVPPQP